MKPSYVEIINRFRTGAQDENNTSEKGGSGKKNENYALSLSGSFPSAFPDFALDVLRLDLFKLSDQLSSTRQNLAIARMAMEEQKSGSSTDAAKVLRQIESKMPEAIKSMNKFIQAEKQFFNVGGEKGSEERGSRRTSRSKVSASVKIPVNSATRGAAKDSLSHARSGMDGAQETAGHNSVNDLQILKSINAAFREEQLKRNEVCDSIEINLEDLAILHVHLCQRYQSQSGQDLDAAQVRKLFIDVQQLKHEVELYGTDKLNPNLTDELAQMRIKPMRLALDFVKSTLLFVISRDLQTARGGKGEFSEIGLFAGYAEGSLQFSDADLQKYSSREDSRKCFYESLEGIASAVEEYFRAIPDKFEITNTKSKYDQALLDLVEKLKYFKTGLSYYFSDQLIKNIFDRLIIEKINPENLYDLKFEISS